MGARQRAVRASDGAHLAAYDWGGVGKPLLLVHANGFHGHGYSPMVEQLCKHYHCYSYDSRGHGQSPIGGTANFWEKFIEDCLTVVHALGLSGCRVFAHSMGATVALGAEAARPGTFSKMYLYEPVLCSPALAKRADERAGSRMLSSIARRRRSTFPSAAAAQSALAAKPPFCAFHPAALDAYLQHGLVPQEDGSVRLACDPATEAAIFAHFVQHVNKLLFAQLKSMSCRHVVVASGRDSGQLLEWLPAASLEVAAAVPGSKHVKYPNLDHMGPMCHPSALAAEVLKYFDDGLDWEGLPGHVEHPVARL